MESYIFSLPEIWYIASQSAPCIILGIADPTVGMTTQEITDFGQTAYKKLRDRKLIVNKDGNDKFVDDLLIISYACAHPENSVVLSIEEVPSTKQIRYFNYSHGLVVEITAINSSNYEAIIHTSKHFISEMIRNVLKNKVFIFQESNPIYIPADKFDEFLFCVTTKEYEKASSIIKTGKVESRKFLQAVESPIFNFSITVHHSRNNPDCQYISGFGILGSKNSIWKLNYCKEGTMDYIEIRPTTTVQFQTQLEEILP